MNTTKSGTRVKNHGPSPRIGNRSWRIPGFNPPYSPTGFLLLSPTPNHINQWCSFKFRARWKRMTPLSCLLLTLLHGAGRREGQILSPGGRHQDRSRIYNVSATELRTMASQTDPSPRSSLSKEIEICAGKIHRYNSKCGWMGISSPPIFAARSAARIHPEFQENPPSGFEDDLGDSTRPEKSGSPGSCSAGSGLETEGPGGMVG